MKAFVRQLLLLLSAFDRAVVVTIAMDMARAPTRLLDGTTFTMVVLVAAALAFANLKA